jgi:acetylornithine deacetylase/succinyl-diaminopimelate desuccinylase-like protein
VTTSQSISWTDVALEASEHLGRLLAIGTGCPPSYELPAARYLLELFEREGIPALILPPSTGTPGKALSSPRPNLVAHLPGGATDEPLLLLSHLDSAPRSLGAWELDLLTDRSLLRGSGSTAGTHLAVAHAMALILLSRNAVPLRRTVRYATTSEGMGGKGLGLATLAQDHIEHITSDIAIGWGGLSWTGRNGEPYSFLTTGEKGVLNLKLRSEGPGGYPGINTGKDPVENLLKALTKIIELDLPPHSSNSSRNTIRSIASTLPDSKTLLFSDLLDSKEPYKILDSIELDPEIDPGLIALAKSSLATECTIMHVEALGSDGLRPRAAEASLAFSYPPGGDPENLARRVMETLHPDGVYLAEKEILPPSESELSPEIFAMVRASLVEVDPRAVLVSGLAPWAAGLGSFRRFGTSVFGFEPFISSGTLSETLSHRGGAGESCETANFLNEIRAIYSLLCRMAQ